MSTSQAHIAQFLFGGQLQARQTELLAEHVHESSFLSLYPIIDVRNFLLPTTDNLSERKSPVLLTHICRTWINTAHATPLLWNSMRGALLWARDSICFGI